MATQDFSLQQLQPFLEGNPERGVLRVQVATGRGAFPVPRALVEVAVMINGGRIPLYRKRTDSSGIADGFVLPAKPFYESQQPSTAAESAAHYVVSVAHPAADHRLAGGSVYRYKDHSAGGTHTGHSVKGEPPCPLCRWFPPSSPYIWDCQTVMRPM